MKDVNKKEMSPLLKLFYKLSIITLIVFAVIFYSDSKGYFNPDKANDHTLKKWKSFHELNDGGVNFDIMLFGNSHLYTGINPKNLSLALGVNAFIFASPGTITPDYYFSIKEAIITQKPKIVIVETFGMNEFNTHDLTDGKLSNQIVSFSARKDVKTKLLSTPALFKVQNYLYAWSTTLRNHDYLFTNSEQIETNKIISANPNQQKINTGRLYLGRYVRFTSGIENTILQQYKDEGAPINGNDFNYSEDTKKYAKKIIDLCKKENIELVFLTLPMYEKHIENYASWDAKLKEITQQEPSHWINLQNRPNYDGFDTYAFESTYNKSQHMTYNGSILATYKLADYIRDSVTVDLPNRASDVNWLQMYYGDEGYFENYLPAPNDPNNKTISTKKVLTNVTINSLSSINDGNGSKLIAKVDHSILQNIANKQNTKLQLLLEYNNNGQIGRTTIELKYDLFYSSRKEILFTSYIKPVDITNLIDGSLSY